MRPHTSFLKPTPKVLQGRNWLLIRGMNVRQSNQKYLRQRSKPSQNASWRFANYQHKMTFVLLLDSIFRIKICCNLSRRPGLDRKIPYSIAIEDSQIKKCLPLFEDHDRSNFAKKWYTIGNFRGKTCTAVQI